MNINGGFNPESYEVLFSKEEKSFWFRSRNKLIILLMKKYFPNFTSFMEVGCGTGYVLNGIKKAFPNRVYFGTELYEEGLLYARLRLPNVEFEQFDVVKMNLNRTFDVVGAFDVLEHISEDEIALMNISKAIGNSHGGVILTVPQHAFLWSDTDVSACHVRRYSKKELVSKLEATGFECLCVTGFVSLLMPAMWLSRKGNKKTNDGLSINSVLDITFEMIMAIERCLIRCGVRFPFGGSLIAIGVKKVK